MKPEWKSTKGFTMLEISIVIAIIAVLAAIAIPTYIGMQKKAARSEARAKLEAIALTLEGHMAENNDYGLAGFYTYVCGPACVGASFGHSGPIGTLANMGNNLIYDYQITVTTAPSFGVSAIPRVGGRMENDMTVWLQSNGLKGPAGAGW